MYVCDIILKRPVDVYTQLKKRLIEHFSVIGERRINQLLNRLDIGDKKSCMLLRDMRNLANDDVTDEVLRTMWIQRLQHIHIQLNQHRRALTRSLIPIPWEIKWHLCVVLKTTPH